MPWSVTRLAEGSRAAPPASVEAPGSGLLWDGRYALISHKRHDVILRTHRTIQLSEELTDRAVEPRELILNLEARWPIAMANQIQRREAHAEEVRARAFAELQCFHGSLRHEGRGPPVRACAFGPQRALC